MEEGDMTEEKKNYYVGGTGSEHMVSDATFSERGWCCT